MGYDYIQVIRGIACLMVVIDHGAGLFVSGIPNYKTSLFAPFLIPEGFPWVWLFLIISGYLNTKSFFSGRYSLSRHGICAFYRNRVLRIFPLMWFLMLLWILFYLIGLWPNALPRFSFIKELSIAFALPWVPYLTNSNPIASMNSPIWTVIIIIHFCFLIPFLLILINSSWKKLLGLISLWFAAMILLAGKITLSGHPAIFPLIYGTHYYNFGFFAAGMLLAISPSKQLLTKMPLSLSLIITIFAIGVVQYE